MRERSTARLRRWAAGAAMLVGIGLLSACVAIPTSGAVVEGPKIDKAVGGDFEFGPEGPVPNASQEQILRGFIGAFTGPQNDYKVARQFLTTDFSGKWEPRGSVLVRAGGFSFDSVDANTMTYSFKTLAAVDATGSYTESANPSQQTLTYRFVKEGKQWRISDAPSGIVLSEGTFGIVFSPQSLYFLDPSLTHLVPDQRWYPAGTAATRIVNALLAGPPPWLKQGAVTSAFPDGTQLTSPKVVLVASGVAKIDLNSEALTASDRERQLIRLQLTASLSGLASIRSVAISVNGSPYPISDADADLPELRPEVDGRALVLRERQFGYYANGEVTELGELSEAVRSTRPTAATVDAARGTAAVLGARGVYAVRAGKAVLVDERRGLVAPSLDDFGYVWSVPAADPSALRVFGPDGKAHNVAPTLPRDARVVSIDVSRDGARMAVLMQTASGPRVIVAAILRDPDQRFVPTTLGRPVLDTGGEPGQALDATWMDELSVAVLSTDDGATRVMRYGVGGMREALGRTGDVVRIVGGNGTDNLRLLDAKGVIEVPRGSSWSSTEVAVDLLATQR